MHLISRKLMTAPVKTQTQAFWLASLLSAAGPEPSNRFLKGTAQTSPAVISSASFRLQPCWKFACAPVTFTIKSDPPQPSQKSGKAQLSMGLQLDYHSFTKAKQTKAKQSKAKPRSPTASQAPRSTRVGASEPGPQRATARHGDRPARAPGAAAGGTGRDGTGEGSKSEAEGQRSRAQRRGGSGVAAARPVPRGRF